MTGKYKSLKNILTSIEAWCYTQLMKNYAQEFGARFDVISKRTKLGYTNKYNSAGSNIVYAGCYLPLLTRPRKDQFHSVIWSFSIKIRLKIYAQ